jgi:hypothetical protein
VNFKNLANTYWEDSYTGYYYKVISKIEDERYNCETTCGKSRVYLSGIILMDRSISKAKFQMEKIKFNLKNGFQ